MEVEIVIKTTKREGFGKLSFLLPQSQLEKNDHKPRQK